MLVKVTVMKLFKFSFLSELYRFKFCILPAYKGRLHCFEYPFVTYNS